MSKVSKMEGKAYFVNLSISLFLLFSPFWNKWIGIPERAEENCFIIGMAGVCICIGWAIAAAIEAIQRDK